MGKLSNIAGLFGDVKTRTIVIFTGVLLALGVGIAFTNLKSDTVNTSGARTAAVPRGIQNVPGAGTATAQYEALQVEENRRRFEEAAASGTSAIPTLQGGFTKVELEPEGGETTTGGELTVEQRIRLQQERAQTRITVQQARQQAEQRIARSQQLQAEKREVLFKGMGKQATAYIKGWVVSPTQNYVEGTAAKDNKGSGANGNGNANGQAQAGQRGASAGLGRGGAGTRQDNLAKAGDMIFAVLDTSIDSDDKGPVLATVVSGKLKGAKLIGAYESTTNQQRIVLKFSQMNIPKAPSTLSVNAVAVNPFNGRPGLATSVDNHYLRRYGSLFVASLLQGYGESIKNQGTELTRFPDGSSRESNPSRSGSEELLIALSQVGTTLGGKTDGIFDTPPTVKVKEGVGLGILFLADVSSAGSGL